MHLFEQSTFHVKPLLSLSDDITLEQNQDLEVNHLYFYSGSRHKKIE